MADTTKPTHPEIAYAERSSATEPEKVSRSSVLCDLTHFDCLLAVPLQLHAKLRRDSRYISLSTLGLKLELQSLRLLVMSEHHLLHHQRSKHRRRAEIGHQTDRDLILRQDWQVGFLPLCSH